MAMIPAFFADATVALSVEQPKGSKVWIGTGFLVGRKEQDNPTLFSVYLITNRHVVDNQQRLDVRFNNNGCLGVKDIPLCLTDKKGLLGFSLHPVKDVDVVAIKINPNVIVKNNLSLSFFDLYAHALTLRQMKDSGVDEGSLVYALGFPMNLVNDSVKAPVCRLGCIARITDAFSAPEKSTMYLVDAQTFPGNSGGPIVNRAENVSITGTPHNSSANLIGILSGYITYRESLYSKQTGRVRMIQEENSGLTIVHPVDRIKEVVELERNRVATT